ncbi:hypothetical protein PG997_009301 [Apiospora hydei]|uniref:Carbohydrate esterase family 3 protein n=1 Tax=Apiospora hydei TaxID=1337664 RepID=A0ABR1VTR2_9PEZI
MPFLSRFASAVSWWKQLPSIYKLVSVTLAVVFLLASGFQSGTVDVNQQWSSLVRGVGGHGSLGGGMPIRIMYIGASMTLGEHSEGERGYRQQIRDWIASKGNPVNCVGAIVPAIQPNLILINAGSSDCFQEGAWGSSNVLNHMRDLVDFLLEASPGPPANAQIRQVSRDLAREGKPVLLAEMHRDQGGEPGHVVDLPEMGLDNMHPTTEGYFVMGDIFKEAILEADKKGWLQSPVPNGIPEDGNAERMAEGSRRPN